VVEESACLPNCWNGFSQQLIRPFQENKSPKNGEFSERKASGLGGFNFWNYLSDDLRAVWRPRGRGDLTTLARTLPIVAARSLSSTAVQQELSKLVEQAHADETALLKLQALLQEPIINDSPFPSVIHYVTTQAGLHYQKAREVLLFTVYPGEPRDALLTLLNRVLPAIDVD
jgi:hypothetical protein